MGGVTDLPIANLRMASTLCSTYLPLHVASSSLHDFNSTTLPALVQHVAPANLLFHIMPPPLAQPLHLHLLIYLSAMPGPRQCLPLV